MISTGKPVHIALSVAINAPAQAVWEAITDWPAQGQWMLGTKVWVTHGDGQSAGSTLAAYTGIKPLGFLDTMTITRWEPPVRCDVIHTGRVVRGTGTMAVSDLGNGRSEFHWSEDLDLPLGIIGQLGFPLVKPFFVAGVRASLEKFARLVEAQH